MANGIRTSDLREFNKGRSFANCLLFFLFPGVWGMPTGPKVFWDFAGHVWAAALRPDLLFKKGHVTHLSGGGTEKK